MQHGTRAEEDSVYHIRQQRNAEHIPRRGVISADHFHPTGRWTSHMQLCSAALTRGAWRKGKCRCWAAATGWTATLQTGLQLSLSYSRFSAAAGDGPLIGGTGGRDGDSAQVGTEEERLR
jgi:hypothetical protein